MRPPNKLDDDYRELDLDPGASLVAIKSSYRELALFWHPDRFHDRPSRLAKAHEKMTRINLAYERLRRALAKAPHLPPAAPGMTSAPARPRERHQPRETRTNSLKMNFVSVPGTSVLFSIWETRVQDYMAYAQAEDAHVFWKNPGFSQTATHPVVNVSWDDAKGFCLWL